MIIKEYRNQGAVGALLDEYEKALTELLDVIEDINSDQLIFIFDTSFDDENNSIQGILTHVLQSGYTYAIEVRKWMGEEIEYENKLFLTTIQEYRNALKEMFVFNEDLFISYPKIKLVEFDVNKKIKTRWGQLFDVEQLFQHAIVHLLRHRRQIEIIKLKLNKVLD
jgi:uncharacterized damage-inducible protein DinB